MTMQNVTLAEFAQMLERFPFKRNISSIHLHQSRQPNHRTYKGYNSLVEMAQRHRGQLGLSDVAQHLTIDPQGTIWLGRNWNSPPASVAGHNGSEHDGPFMIMLVGDFDIGGDPLTNNGSAENWTAQMKAALRVIALLQQWFKLRPESVRLRRQLSGSTGSGAMLDYDPLLKALNKEKNALKAEESAPKDHPFSQDALLLNQILDEFSRSVPTGADRAAEIVEGGISPMTRQSQPVHHATPPTVNGQTVSRAGEAPITFEMIDALQPHVINLSHGRFSTGGHMKTYEVDVDAIFEEHIPRWLETRPQESGNKKKTPLNLVLYAHGGLVSEANALRHAHSQLNWWRENQVYPIYFIWETGFLETIRQMLFQSEERARAAARGWFTDPIVEKLVRHLGGPLIWQGMKESAHLASAPGSLPEKDGGARKFAQKLKEFCAKHDGEIALHAVGHSAGAIFLGHFFETAKTLEVPAFRSLHLMAPAITVDDFSAQIFPLLTAEGDAKPWIEQATLFNLRRNYEENDPTARVYNQSILYLVHRALEPESETDILGLEISLRQAERDLQKAVGLGSYQSDQRAVIWTPTTGIDSGRSASQAKTHVDFNVDPATMNSVLRRIRGVDDSDPITEYPVHTDERSLFGWANQFDLPPELDRIFLSWGGASSLPTAPTQPMTFSTNGSGGRRRALCVGIDRYRQSPLSGCVADARLWAETLTGLGFESPRMVFDEEATRARILEELRTLVVNSQPGDVVVFQYAGHGTQVSDVSGDEVGEDTALTDEAICPIDYAQGALLIDDDIRLIFNQIPDGVNVTCFIDCCHSGTISRFAIGLSEAELSRSWDERPRYLELSQDEIQAHIRFRQRQGTRSLRTRGPASMREVVFSACLSSEVAWESKGHGEFTVRATELLRSGRAANMTHAEYCQAVIDAFGAAPRQRPNLDCAPAARELRLLQPTGTDTAVNSGLVHSSPFG